MILRLCVVIPTHNNPRTISKVLKDVVTSVPFPVLVIDDGSETAVENVLYSYEVREALAEGRIKVHRFSENRGKGAALKFAIEELVARGFTHMITMDGDGKHIGSEINKLVKIAKIHPWDLVITNRDAQSGFRIYPLFALQTMEFWTNGYDFEVEVLLRFMMRGISVRKTEVETRKPELTIQPGWGRWLHDRARYHSLDVLLKTISLLKGQRAMGQLAVGVGVGAFIGCTPFFGFHTLIAAGVAMVLPLNFLAMWLGTHVSTVPLAPFIVIASMVIGKSIPGLADFEGPLAHFYHWLAGSVVLGAGLGLSLAGLVYLCGLLYRRSAMRMKNTRASHHLRRAGVSVLQFSMRKFGLNFGLGFSYAMSAAMWVFSRRARRALVEFFAILQPDLRWPMKQKRIFAHLLSYNQMRIERLFVGLSERNVLPVKPSGLEHLADNHTAVVLGAHLGSLQLGIELLELPVRPMFADRLTHGQTEVLPFFGKLAPFNVSAFREAAEDGRPVIFAFSFKDGGGRQFVAQRPRRFTFDRKSSSEEQILGWSREFVHELEKQVLAHPDQWFNLFPYWSAVPARSLGHTVNPLLEELKSPTGAAGSERTKSAGHEQSRP